MNLLLDSPGGMFGSCRYKLPEKENSIGHFFYNGGNDSADTCYKISEAAKMLNYSLNAIAIPKTIFFKYSVYL